MIKLRPYQSDVKFQIFQAWQFGYRHVLLVLPTGMGKTKTFCSLVIDTLTPHAVPTAIMVHRKELVQQISITLAEEGIFHNLIASRKDIGGIIKAHRRELGKSFYNANAPVTVISVDTLLSRAEIYKNWIPGVLQVITDEAAHVLKDNKWGRALSLFINARSLGVTATPERLDRKGLGSHADGVYDIMVEGPPTAWGIKNKFLSKYKIVVPPSDFSQHLKEGNDTSDYSKQAMIEASNKSQIVGDVVKTYLKFAKGKQAIYFATDVDTSRKMAKQFNDAGIIAKSLDGTTVDSERLDSLIKFRERKIRVLVNVDLFDEGLDVPGIEVVGMARPTKSLGKFLQMGGRGLRLADGKDFMLLIDHVGNVRHHGFIDDIRKWTLDRITKRGSKLNLIRICINIMCNAPFDRALSECPWCGFEAIKRPGGGEGGGLRAVLEQVDGDLELLDPDELRLLANKSKLQDPGVIGAKAAAIAGGPAGIRAAANQQERIEMQTKLIDMIALWAGQMRHNGYSDRSIHKKFFLQHQKTITEALGEPKADMEHTYREIEGNL